MDLDIRLVRYFVAVADELHFGRAAAKLYISQPALSKQIRKLESEVGTQLLVRDSRHVELTARGEHFLVDARQLLALADRMRRPPETNTVRFAHIFELDTSRQVADAFSREYADVQLIERSMDSARQLDALLSEQLDVAVLRVTPKMLAERPTGWQRRLLRLEPMWLVGRPGDEPRDSVSLHERPVEVFADTAESGLYNVHGEYLAAFERETRVALRWLGNPGTFQHCLAAVRRARDSAFTMEFESYAKRYAEAGIPAHRPMELQPAYPWWVAWREDNASEATAAFVTSAQELSERNGWLQPSVGGTPLWLPAGDPGVLEQRSS
ncbi:LysR family transcriptional regulator [Marmoricola sp. URHB0036]|uniref:LysR family transcriptional regulator n=1 Tax=Marmoricola sp. URHB0036 TaxID=1298863 RepID=UPI0004062B4F|nr:LysR family transcriptional regulator [Marmoricola sp. URHB0036]